jgi:hypothetical protein
MDVYSNLSQACVLYVCEEVIDYVYMDKNVIVRAVSRR